MSARVVFPVLLFMAGCVPMYKGPSTNRTASVQVAVDGLQTHTMYPNDYSMLSLFVPGRKNPFASIKLSTDSPQRQLSLDAGRAYTVQLASSAASFGSVVSCFAETNLSPLEGEKFAMSFYTRGTSCSMTTRVMRVGSSQFDLLATNAGRVATTRYTACVRGPGCP